MRKITKANLKGAFAGESQAYTRYIIFSEKAEQEGFSNVARLFKAIAYAEKVHSANHLKALNQLLSTSENLKTAIEGETYEVNEMYPAYRAIAELQGERRAQVSFEWALRSEQVHAGMYQKALQAVEKGEDADIGVLYVCEVCGYTVEGSAPERCPVCGAPKEKFRKF